VSAEALYLTLRAAEELVALPVARVKEIFEPDFTTPLPGAPRAFRGVINLRGSVVPVVDLGVALGLAEAPRADAMRSGERMTRVRVALAAVMVAALKAG